LLLYNFFSPLQGLPIQLLAGSQAKRLGLQTRSPWAGARRSDLPPTLKVGQTKRLVAAAWGTTTQAWPAQHLALTAKHQVSATPWACLQPIGSYRQAQCSWVLREDPFLFGPDVGPNRIIINVIIFITQIIIFITQIIIFRNPRILLTQIIISLIWIFWIIRKIKMFITQININNNIFYIYTLNYNKKNNIFYVAPDIAAALKNITRKEQISDILFFWGKMSCLRSHHLVL